MADAVKNIGAKEILDSRGNPTVEAVVTLESGITASATVPSGSSTGSYEAYELRDGDPTRYGGQGVLKAVRNITTTIRDALLGYEVREQRAIDGALIALDGTESKLKLGANAILPVSLAIARAAARSQKIPLYRYIRSLTTLPGDFRLPIPLLNVINGGKHSNSNLDLQEFWIIPHRAPSFRERLEQGKEVFRLLGELLREQDMKTDLGDEGGYAPDFANHRHVFDTLMQAIEKTPYGSDLSLGFDAGATVFYNKEEDTYALSLEGEYLTDELIDFYRNLLGLYPIIAIEDPLAEDEWPAWQQLTHAFAQVDPALRIIGDDLFTTSPTRLKRGIDMAVANGIIIKPNQVGTLSETLDCVMLAKKHNYTTIISHRSGETNDSFIADLAVAVSAEYIKSGSTARPERMVKYARLLEIEEELYGSKK